MYIHSIITRVSVIHNTISWLFKSDDIVELVGPDTQNKKAGVWKQW